MNDRCLNLHEAEHELHNIPLLWLTIPICTVQSLP